MFTGIVREIGRIVSREAQGDTRFRISCARPARDIEIGASIACDGVCLTAVAKGETAGEADGASWFDVQASAETLARTTLGAWQPGTRVNLEPALKVGDELGGHIVTGHVDAVGRVAAIRPEGASTRIEVDAPASIAPFIAEKSSITLAGVSLTVNAVEDTGGGCRFGINIIPHTQEVTTLGGIAEGSEVNLEIDVLARYVARLDSARRSG